MQQRLCEREVVNGAFADGPDRGDVLGCSSDHPLGFHPEREDPRPGARALYGDDGGFFDNDAFPTHIDERVCGSEVNGELMREEPERLIQHRPTSSVLVTHLHLS
jgi:hypothetical protein